MKKSIRWRLGLILLSVVIALFLFLPSTPLQASLPEWWKQSVPKIALGLDLRGGSYLVMQVEAEKAVEAFADNIAADLQNTATSQGLAVTFMRRGQDVTAKFAEPLEDRAADFVKKNYAILDSKSRSKGELVYSIKQSNVYGLKENAVQQAKERTERRINKFGVTEPNVYRQGRDQLVIQLPGIKNPQEAISFM
jgi:preprotein translocase subunit SecD